LRRDAAVAVECRIQVAGPTAGTFDIVIEPYPGDYNRDRKVDGADYVVWRKMLGATGLDSYAGADGDGDGDIDPETWPCGKRTSATCCRRLVQVPQRSMLSRPRLQPMRFSKPSPRRSPPTA
jgi:hypothetical protein